ncbi:MAG: 23S rRNA (guanosine(2251)-2'-O)-methyltransferase RlmB [Cytophagaceae bacterium]|jgi:23S rRNA (guanosine2251-2'-O)-methyltransferase|nr:23S rRNA (guanosine(2251)-2'-O)-methyltransferase RlmB [Cytophagaceae bacterium]
MTKENTIYGIRAIIEAIDSGKSIEKIYVKHGLLGELFNELRKTAQRYDIPMQYVPGEKINKLVQGNHQGVVAVISPVEFHDITGIVNKRVAERKNSFVIVLDGITDVRNFGAIARTAESAGVDAIVIPEKGSVPVNADAIKTSAGALFRIPVCKAAKPWYVLKFLKELNFTIIGASEKAEVDYRSVDYSGNIALIFGSEEKGISPQLLKMCDKVIAIPLKGETASLNVSVAAGILMFEAIK